MYREIEPRIWIFNDQELLGQWQIRLVVTTFTVDKSSQQGPSLFVRVIRSSGQQCIDKRHNSDSDHRDRSDPVTRAAGLEAAMSPFDLGGPWQPMFDLWIISVPPQQCGEVKHSLGVATFSGSPQP